MRRKSSKYSTNCFIYSVLLLIYDQLFYIITQVIRYNEHHLLLVPFVSVLCRTALKMIQYKHLSNDFLSVQLHHNRLNCNSISYLYFDRNFYCRNSKKFLYIKITFNYYFLVHKKSFHYLNKYLEFYEIRHVRKLLDDMSQDMYNNVFLLYCYIYT